MTKEEKAQYVSNCMNDIRKADDFKEILCHIIQMSLYDHMQINYAYTLNKIYRDMSHCIEFCAYLEKSIEGFKADMKDRAMRYMKDE